MQLLTSVETDLWAALVDDAATAVVASASERTTVAGEVIESWEREMPGSSEPILAIEPMIDWLPYVEEEWSNDVHRSVAVDTPQMQKLVKDLFSARLP